MLPRNPAEVGGKIQPPLSTHGGCNPAAAATAGTDPKRPFDPSPARGAHGIGAGAVAASLPGLSPRWHGLRSAAMFS
jgi:hypothetical protein